MWNVLSGAGWSGLIGERLLVPSSWVRREYRIDESGGEKAINRFGIQLNNENFAFGLVDMGYVAGRVEPDVDPADQHAAECTPSRWLSSSVFVVSEESGQAYVQQHPT